jgi:3-hydroxyisobutyrate dehydrogenase-like beta-hydroxyacid dehydrogenase
VTLGRVGFIGLGNQGAPMAQRILEEGFSLAIWARRSESIEPFAGSPATVKHKPADLGRASDIVGICVVDGADVEDVVLRSDGVLAGMAPGGVIAIHSTVHPATCRQVAEVAAPLGVSVIDAPVSGGGAAAAERRLLVMVGGDDTAVAQCRPVFETFGDPIIHLGGIGSGQLAKLVNNLVFTAQIAVAQDTFDVGDRLGIDRAALAEVLAHGSGNSRAAAILAGLGFGTTGMQHAAPLLRKDVGIVLDVLSSAGESAPGILAGLADSALAALEGNR